MGSVVRSMIAGALGLLGGAVLTVTGLWLIFAWDHVRGYLRR